MRATAPVARAASAPALGSVELALAATHSRISLSEMSGLAQPGAIGSDQVAPAIPNETIATERNPRAMAKRRVLNRIRTSSD